MFKRVKTPSAPRQAGRPGFKAAPPEARPQRRSAWWSCRLSLILGVACGGLHPIATQGAAYASGSLDLNGISVTPSVGSVSWGAWTLNSFSSVANSDGAADSQSGSGAASASAAANVPYAQASSSGSASGSSTLSGHVAGTANTPSGTESATVGNAGNYNSWQSTFSIIGGSGVESVTVGALLSSSLKAITDSMGSVLQNDVIFNFNIDGRNVLSFSDSLAAGPNANLSHVQNPVSLADAVISLDSSLTHGVFISIDDEQQVLTVPDQSSSLRLLLVGLAAVAAARRLAAGPSGRWSAARGNAN